MAVDVTWQASNFAETATQTHTFSGMAIGAEAADRLVFVVFGVISTIAANTGTATIGGSAAVGAVSIKSTNLVEVFWLLVPSGTTADITYDAGTGNVLNVLWAATYSVTGADTSNPVSDTDGQSAAADSDTITLDVPANGALIAGTVSGFDLAGGDSLSWTNAIEDLDREDLVVSAYFTLFGTASRETVSALTGEIITVSHTGANLLPNTTLVGVALQVPGEASAGSHVTGAGLLDGKLLQRQRLINA